MAETARRGDLPAQEILKRSGMYIGIAIAGLINLISPSTVIIGGGVAQVGDLLTSSVRQAVRQRSLQASEHGVNITTAMLGRRSSLIGALVQAINVALFDAIERRSASTRNHMEIEGETGYSEIEEVIENKEEQLYNQHRKRNVQIKPIYFHPVGEQEK